MLLFTFTRAKASRHYKKGLTLLALFFIMSAVFLPTQLQTALAAVSEPAWSAVFEAETAQLSGVVVRADNSGYTGTGYADYQHTSNDQISWTVNVPQAGLYVLVFRYANGSNDTRPLDVYVNGNLQAYANPGIFLPTGNWWTWGTLGVSSQLQAGQNTIVTKAIGYSGPNIDNLKISLPIYQGEGATLGGGARITNVNSGYTGTGYIYYRDVNSYSEWTLVNPAPAGTYNLRARYANSYAPQQNIRLTLTVNGVDQGSIYFYSTGSWSTYNEPTIAGIELQNGQNIIRLTAPEGFYSPIIDYISFEYIPGR